MRLEVKHIKVTLHQRQNLTNRKPDWLKDME